MLSEFPLGNYTSSLWFTIIHVDLSRRHSSCCSTKIESLTEICAIKSDTSVLVGVEEASQRPQDIFDLPCLKIWKWFRDLQMPRYNDNTESYNCRIQQLLKLHLLRVLMTDEKDSDHVERWKLMKMDYLSRGFITKSVQSVIGRLHSRRPTTTCAWELLGGRKVQNSKLRMPNLRTLHRHFLDKRPESRWLDWKSWGSKWGSECWQ